MAQTLGAILAVLVLVSWVASFPNTTRAGIPIFWANFISYFHSLSHRYWATCRCAHAYSNRQFDGPNADRDAHAHLHFCLDRLAISFGSAEKLHSRGRGHFGHHSRAVRHHCGGPHRRQWAYRPLRHLCGPGTDDTWRGSRPAIADQTRSCSQSYCRADTDIYVYCYGFFGQPRPSPTILHYGKWVEGYGFVLRLRCLA